MKTINDLRKALKPIGYKIKTKSLSFGRYATLVHVETGDELTYNVFTAETLARWQPAFDFFKANAEAIETIAETEEITGFKRFIK